jgi:hypothetical protein
MPRVPPTHSSCQRAWSRYTLFLLLGCSAGQRGSRHGYGVSGQIVQNSLTDSVLVREVMLVRHQMFDELVLARESSTRDAARATGEVTVEAGGRGMSGSDVTSQIAFASIMLEATVVRTVMAFMDGVKIEAWSRKWGK